MGKSVPGTGGWEEGAGSLERAQDLHLGRPACQLGAGQRVPRVKLAALCWNGACLQDRQLGTWDNGTSWVLGDISDYMGKLRRRLRCGQGGGHISSTGNI